ncbi:MAG TPA: tetratricopeptide repeat protein, partial [Candidatus Polarisedimenticolia bacterium]|nr:tetratricopeptide repeat protein [Candidatus Polarisedimenticolia bacterium]
MRFRQVRHAVVLALLAAGLPAQGPPLPEPDISSLPETIRKELAEARKKAEAAPGDAQAAGEVGMLYFVYDLSAAAAGCFERAAALAPTELRWRYYLGLARERAGEPGGAIDALEQAVAIDASRPPVLVKLADLLRERDPSRAGELYRKALSSDPAVAAAHFGLGECARQAGRGEEALGHYRAAALASPEWAAPHYAAAMILASSGRREEATRHLRLHAAGGERPADDDPLLVALMSRGRNASMLRREAARLAKTGRVEDAVALLRQAIDTDVGGSTSRHHLGLVLAQNGRFEEA